MVGCAVKKLLRNWTNVIRDPKTEMQSSLKANREQQLNGKTLWWHKRPKQWNLCKSIISLRGCEAPFFEVSAFQKTIKRTTWSCGGLTKVSFAWTFFCSVLVAHTEVLQGSPRSVSDLMTSLMTKKRESSSRLIKSRDYNKLRSSTNNQSG